MSNNIVTIKRTISISESRSGMYSGYAERRKVRLSESKDLLAGILPSVALSIKLNGRMKFNVFMPHQLLIGIINNLGSDIFLMQILKCRMNPFTCQVKDVNLTCFIPILRKKYLNQPLSIVSNQNIKKQLIEF